MSTLLQTYFYDPNVFEWAKHLENAWQDIRTELDAALSLRLQNHLSNAPQWFAAYPHYVISETEGVAWKTLDFSFFGIKNLHNCRQCPHTAKLLEQIPELVSASFSMMEPQTHILPHKGFTQMVLRCHLGLFVPHPEQCALRVGNQTRSWKEGKLMVFNDSFEHEAWNKSDKQRAVLMFDIAHPQCNYNADQICRYKMERITQDPFMQQVADQATWIKWYEQGHFPVN